MKKFYLAIVAILTTTMAFSQGTITGTVVDGELGSPLPGATIMLRGTETGTSTDFDGNFTLEVSANSGTLVVSYIGFVTQNVSFSSIGSVGNITLQPDAEQLSEVIVIGNGVIDLAEDRETPVAVSTIGRVEIQERAVGNVELPEIIKTTPSVFVSNQTGFGDGSLFIRGFDDTNTAVLLNGQPINSQEDGRIFWSNWAGMADIANAVQVQRGLGASKLAISSVGGTVNIVMRAAQKSEGGSARFFTGNDSYFKGTVEYNTGVNEEGWAFSVLLDHWQSHRKWGEGTFGQGQNYFFAVGYTPNDTHSFNFLLTGAPQFHGNKWSQNLETTLNDPKFNQHWGFTEGFDDGVGGYTSNVDSERRNYYHKPVMNLNWDWTISDKSNLSSVLYASWGRGGGTGPRGNRIRTADGQLDYFAIEQFNESIGVGGFDNPETGYIRRASVNNHQWYGLVSNFNHEANENLTFNVGTDLRYYMGDHWRQVVDLYGLSAWEEGGRTITETFEADPWQALFNFADDDQRIDYNYSETITYQGIFGQSEYANDRFSVFFQGAVSNQSYKRFGSELDDDGDGGNSDVLNKLGYNLKGGFSFNLNENHKLYFNTGFYSRQPFLDNVFTNIRGSNEFVEPEVDNEDITGFEAGYQITSGSEFRAMFNFYYTDWDNRVILSSGTLDLNPVPTPGDDSDDTNVNFFDRGVRQVHAGAELEVEYRPTNWVRLGGFISGGSWEFKDTSNRDVYNDDTGELIERRVGDNRDGVKVTTAPQFTAGFNARATIFQGFSLDGNIKFYGNRYQDEIDFDSEPQTENAGKLDPFNLTDLGLTYDFPFGENTLTFRANVYNVFDKRGIQDTDVFGFFPIQGLTFNSSVRYSF